MPNDPRLASLITLFGPRVGRRLAHARFMDLVEAVDNPAHPITMLLEGAELIRLKAVVQLCWLYYPEQPHPPSSIRCTADAVRYLSARCAAARERTVWMLALDERGVVLAEALVLFGGERTTPPSARSLLRHAIIKEAATAVVVDFRPLLELVVDDATQAVANRLRRLGNEIGIRFLDYVLVGPEGALSVDGWRPPIHLVEAA